MKILDEILEIRELREKISILEKQVENHEKVIEAIANAMRIHSSSIVIVSNEVKKIIDVLNSLSKTRDFKKNEDDDIYH